MNVPPMSRSSVSGSKFLCGYRSNRSGAATRYSDFRILESVTWVRDRVFNVFQGLCAGNRAYFIDADLFRKVVRIEDTNANIPFVMTRQFSGKRGRGDTHTSTRSGDSPRSLPPLNIKHHSPTNLPDLYVLRMSH
jgi:hypothetical protein